VVSGSTWAVVSASVLDGAPATVVYGGDDGRFTILERDRGPRQTDSVICLDCLLELQPRLGRGLDVAKEHGTAYCIDGEWQAQREEEEKKATSRLASAGLRPT
jgi:hypothetical protein